jgi:hypothetical protein
MSFYSNISLPHERSDILPDDRSGCVVIQDVEIPIEASLLKLTFQTGGQLNGFLGPALRGGVLKTLRNQECRIPSPASSSEMLRNVERSTKGADFSKYCLGCPLNNDCRYGRAVEPDNLVRFGTVPNGMRGGIRLMTYAVDSGMEAQAVEGEMATLRLLAIGEDAINMSDSVVDLVSRLGRGNGLGKDHVQFETHASGMSRDQWVLSSGSLSREVSGARIPLLEIHLGSPLAAQGASESEERPIQTLLDFLKPAMATVRRVVREAGNDLSLLNDVNYGEFQRVAEQIRCESSTLAWHKQPRSSERRPKRGMKPEEKGQVSHDLWLDGWLGSVQFRNVPESFLSWLSWAGRLGVGKNRDCGSGIWCLMLR